MSKHVHTFDVVRSFKRPGEAMILVGECGGCGTTQPIGANDPAVTESVLVNAR